MKIKARRTATDARTDIWSLGVVLYEMLAGKVPFTGETVNRTIVSILEKEPLLLENVPGELQRIVHKSLTKDADMRYQTAHDLLIDLKNLRRDLCATFSCRVCFFPSSACARQRVARIISMIVDAMVRCFLIWVLLCCVRLSCGLWLSRSLHDELMDVLHKPDGLPFPHLPDVREVCLNALAP